MRLIASLLLCIAFNIAFAQPPSTLEPGKSYKDVAVSKSADVKCKLMLVKGGVYNVVVLQRGVDVVVALEDASGKQLLSVDSPNGSDGPEKFEYTADKTASYFLIIKRLDEAGNPESGIVDILFNKLSKADLDRRERIVKELAPENAKTVQTIDIDHFWEAFDNLKNCKTHLDSVDVFQRLYLDRATTGLIDFISARGFTAEGFVKSVAHFPKFYNSVRMNTYEVKKAAPLIDTVFARFKALYPHFKPFKVCFAIGVINTGGTVSANFVLIGTEVTTSTKGVDLSEFNGSAFSKVLAGSGDLVQKIRNIVAHECVHTQQKNQYAEKAIRCNLLNSIMKEGFCDFIGELVAQGQINALAKEYGDLHEKQLWQDMKKELCNTGAGNWLYNYSTVKDKPADLGYYMGYKIAEEYYKNASDKRQAVTDIIEMNDPIHFLEVSGYDLKEKK